MAILKKKRQFERFGTPFAFGVVKRNPKK